MMTVADPGVILTLAELGFIYHKRGMSQLAISYVEKAFTLTQNLHGENALNLEMISASELLLSIAHKKRFK